MQSVCKPSNRLSRFLSANLFSPSVYTVYLSSIYHLSAASLSVCPSVYLSNVHPDMSGCRSSFKALHLLNWKVLSNHLNRGQSRLIHDSMSVGNCFHSVLKGHYHKWRINPFYAADFSYDWHLKVTLKRIFFRLVYEKFSDLQLRSEPKIFWTSNLQT
jgi:hypothetical protein